jgi:uncharacterized protein YbaP (TraB family)
VSVNLYPRPGYLYQLTRKGNGIESIRKACFHLKEKEQTLYIYLIPSASDVNPFNNCRLKSIMNEVEVVVFDTPPQLEKDGTDYLCELLQKKYNKEALLSINDTLTQSLTNRNIDMTFVDQNVGNDNLEKLAKGIVVKALILMANNLDLEPLSSDAIKEATNNLSNLNERMNPKQRIHQKAEETKKIIEYIDPSNAIKKQITELLSDKEFLWLFLCEFLADQQLTQGVMTNFEVEGESWKTGTLKEVDYSKLENHPTVVALQKKIEGIDGNIEKIFTLAKKINNYLSNKKTLFVLEESPQTIQQLKPFISISDNIEVQGPIKEPIGCFWKIKKKDITVGYLLGSIHITPSYLLDLNSRIQKCFQKSNRLAVEIDITRQDVVKRSNIEAKKLWEEKYRSLTNEQIDNISTALKKIFSYGSELINFNDNQEKSDFIFSALSELESKIFSELKLFSGIDSHLIQQAKNHSKSIEDLETAEQYKQQETTQAIIANEPIRDVFLQILSLEELKQSKEASKAIKFCVEQLSIYQSESLKPIYEAWEEGNLEELDHSKDDSTEEKMDMTQRNMNMAMKIVRLVRDDNDKIFCCVGAAHTVGEMKIQDFLKNFGFSTERVLV